MNKQLIILLLFFFRGEILFSQTISIFTTYSHVAEYKDNSRVQPIIKDGVILRPTKWEIITKDNKVQVVYNGFIKYSIINSIYHKDYYELIVYNNYFQRQFKMNVFFKDNAIAIDDELTNIRYYYYNK